MKKIALIFDLDGTLIDSAEDLALAVNGMLQEFGYSPISLDQVRDFIGDGTPKLTERTLRTVGAISEPDHEDFDKYYQVLLKHYEANIANKSTVYPGVFEFLDSHSDHPMGVVTNKPSRFTMPTLEAHDLAKYFSFVAGGDAFELKKPDPYPIRQAMEALKSVPQRTLMIGDGDTDILAGNAAGAFTVAVLYGNRPEEELLNLSPNYSIRKFAELNSIVEEIEKSVAF